jgi:acylphosphatase
MICRRCRVRGLVQGVWYRDTTRRKALELGVSGSAVNLADGSVEVVACGPQEAVDALCEWLWSGSKMSNVSDVACEPVDIEVPAGFTIG